LITKNEAIMKKTRDQVTLGKKYFNSKQYAKAEECLRKVFSINEKFADVANMLGVIHHIEGKFSQALDFFKRAIKINPKYTEALLNLTILLNDLGKYKEARALYAIVHQKEATPGSKQIEPVLKGKLSNMHADLGDIYRSVGLYSHAIEEYNKALHLNPNYYDIKIKLGETLRENGELNASLKELEDVIRKKANSHVARVQLGITLYSLGKKDKAVKEWNAVIKKDPKNDFAKMYLHLCESKDNTKKVSAKKTSRVKAKKRKK